jgi:hypothetical protein
MIVKYLLLYDICSPVLWLIKYNADVNNNVIKEVLSTAVDVLSLLLLQQQVVVSSCTTARHCETRTVIVSIVSVQTSCPKYLPQIAFSLVLARLVVAVAVEVAVLVELLLLVFDNTVFVVDDVVSC